MALEVELISTQTIKPSSPTSPHLKTLKLSFLDQLMPLAPIPFVLFYSPTQDENNFDKLDHLKKSLSDALTYFYPLAGRISDNLAINCNDEGVSFFHTHVTGQFLDQVVTSPICDEMTELLPKDNFTGEEPRVLLSVQANVFDCGGIAVGVRMSHKAGDASSLSFFLHTWAAVARGESESTPVVSPKFDMTTFFPPKDFPSGKMNRPAEKVVTKRFLFSASNIASLRAKCYSLVENPTRVEVITALIWRCAINIADKTSTAVHAINVRTRMDPPLSNAYFGNLVTIGMAMTTPESSLELACLAGRVRESIRKVDSEYVKRLQEGSGMFEFLASFMKINESFLKGETELYSFTSWCRLPFYENDFGWGKPVWANPANFPVKNIIALVDTKSGDGVEAWISLCEADMARFECETELIDFTTNELRLAAS